MKYKFLSKNPEPQYANLDLVEEVSIIHEKNLIVDSTFSHFFPENPENKIYPFNFHFLDFYMEPIKEVKYMPGTYFLACHIYTNNHSHFLHQIFLSILIAKKYKIDLKNIPVVVHNNLDKRKKEFLALLGDITIIELASYKDTAFLFENALFPSTLLKHSISGELASLFLEFRNSLELSRPLFNNKIYISRKDSYTRTATNESKLITYLEKEGFSILELANLSAIEQINAFSFAKTILAPHGAGGANLLFSDDNIKVIELFYEKYREPCHINIAYSKNCYFHGTLNEIAPDTYGSTPLCTDFIIDFDLLKNTMEEEGTKFVCSSKPSFYKSFDLKQISNRNNVDSIFKNDKQLQAYIQERLNTFHEYFKFHDHIPKNLTYFYKAMVYSWQNNFEKAVEYAKKACELGPNILYYQAYLLRLSAKCDDIINFESLLQKLIHQNPHSYQIYNAASLFYKKRYDLDKAIKYAKIATEVEPSNIYMKKIYEKLLKKSKFRYAIKKYIHKIFGRFIK